MKSDEARDPAIPMREKLVFWLGVLLPIAVMALLAAWAKFVVFRIRI